MSIRRLKWKTIMVKWILPFYLFSFLPLNAQVGTWRAYMSYYEPQQIVKAGNALFVRASNDLYQYNLTDHSITTYNKITGLSDSYITHIAWNQQAKRLIIVYQNSNIDLMDQNGNVSNISALYRKAMTDDKTVDSLTIDGPYAYLYAHFGIVKVNMQRAEITDTYTKNHPDYPTNLPPSEANADWNQYIDIVKTLKPEGPKYNNFGFMRFKHNRLYTSGAGYESGVELNRPGTIQILKDNEWIFLQDNIQEITGWEYTDVGTVDASPVDPDHVFAGARSGLYEFKNGQLVTAHNLDNSPLQTATTSNQNSFVLIEGLCFNTDGSLWCFNSSTRELANLFEYTNEGKWISHQKSELTNNNKSLKGMQAPMFDSRGYLWFVNNNWELPSFYCYDTKNDRFVNSFLSITNQDGTSYSDFTPYCITEDLQGNIWVGTNKGPFMIEKNNIGNADTYLTQIKVPRNDGSDFADYLLSGVNTNCMAIDGGGRKWFGTKGDGVYLISADNMTQIHHFTTANSSLLSDVIESIAINNSTGEVYFGTENGLCSFISDATVANTEMTEDNVYAYPNPVTPDYTGLITVVGLTLNADVKILSSSGKLIAEGRSNGGSFTWDGCDRNGDRVASGVYMVVTADDGGNKGTVCKIAIIK